MNDRWRNGRSGVAAAWTKMWCPAPRSLSAGRARSILARACALRPDTLMQASTPSLITLADGAGHTFFMCQAEPGQGVLHQPDTRRELWCVARAMPAILPWLCPAGTPPLPRSLCEAKASLSVCRLRCGRASVFPVAVASPDRLVDVGNADLELPGDDLGWAAAVDRRQHPAPQIGRVALPPTSTPSLPPSRLR